jgi:stress response protein SCP2
MMSELVPGGNLPLPGGAVAVRVPGPFDVSALVTDDSGKVRGDDDFVFYNQPNAPGARLRGDTLTVDPPRLRAGATRVTVVVSPADPATPLGRLPAPVLHVTGAGGRPLARFAPPRPRQETVLLLAEIYRRDDGWKLRALGQGYADGLAGLARDFGVDVADEPVVSPASPAPSPTRPAPRGPSSTRPAPRTPASAPPTPRAPAPTRPAPSLPSPTLPAHRAPRADPIYPAAHTLSPDPDGFLGLVNSARGRPVHPRSPSTRV